MPTDVFEYGFINVTTFDECEMRYSKFGQTTYEFYNFLNISNLKNAKFENCILMNCTFKNVDFTGCEFIGVTFKNCTFESCNIEEAIFKDSNYIITANNESFMTEKSIKNIKGLNFKRE